MIPASAGMTRLAAFLLLPWTGDCYAKPGKAMDMAIAHHMEYYLVLGAGLIVLSALASTISARLGVPALLLFLVIGMLAGSEGPGGIYFDNTLAAKTLGVLALAIILFAGGLSTDWTGVRPVIWRGLSLSTIGVIVTAGLVGVFSMVVLKFTVYEGFLLGAIVSSTDAAAVFSVLKSKNVSLKRRIQPLLEFESGSNDPISVFLTTVLIVLIQNPQTSPLVFFPAFIQQGTVGVAAGALFGRLTIWIVNRAKLEHEGLYPVLVLCMALLSYGSAHLLGGSGFLAVYWCGLEMARREYLYKKSIVRFHDGLAWLMQIAMFVTLGLLVFPSHLVPVLWPALLVSVFLMFAARPIGVLISLAFARMTVNEKRMVAWVGLRGAAPIVLATFALLAKVPKAEVIFNIVFFVVLGSVLLQGTSVPYVARLLKVDAPLERKRRYPIEFEQTERVDADLIEVMIPYNAAVAGKAIYQLNLPEDSLITLICRDEKFLVPTGKTQLAEGDVVLALANKNNRKEIYSVLSQMRS